MPELRWAVLDDQEGFAAKVLTPDRLPPGVTMRAFRSMPPAELVEALTPFEVVFGMRERTALPRQVLEQLPSLQLLVTAGMYNAAVDILAASEFGIVVAGTGRGGAGPVELTWSLILALARHLVTEDRAIREGRWGTTVGLSLTGRVLGVVGSGRVGLAVARVGQTFGMDVVAFGRSLTPQRAAEAGLRSVSLSELLGEADVVTVHLPETDETRGMFGSREFAAMKPTSLFVNTSRGPVVDEDALVGALDRGLIAGAALDVFDQEPLPSGHPLTHALNTVLSPHRGYVTDAGFTAFYDGALAAVAGLIDGHVPNVLNPEVLESPRLRIPTWTD